MSLKLTPVRVNPALRHPAESRVSLDGEWRFRLDPEDTGETDRWFDRIEVLADPILVPGCWQGQGFGHDGEETLWDFELRARVFRAAYTGTGWYGKEFETPAAWHGKRIWLNFGGAHPSAEVWLNGVRLGENDLPFVPFGFEVTDAVRWDGKNAAIVRVHERNRQFGLVYNWQGNWSGLYRGVELTATGARFIESCAIHPDADRGIMRFRARLGGDPGAGLLLRASTAPVGIETPPCVVEAQAGEREVEFALEAPSPRLWSPETPNLYRVDLALRQGKQALDAWSERVGFVKLAAEGKHLCINNQPYYWRGSGDHLSSCPETGCPDADRDRWRRKLRVLREYGYIYVRCPSFIYPQEYFDAADEVGLLIQSEPGLIGPWGGHSKWHTYQWPKPTPDNYPIMKRQWDLCVWRDVNHPSAGLYCMSNECCGGTEFPRIAWQCCRDTKAIKPAALVIWTDGGCNENMPGDFVNDEAAHDKDVAKPLIQHEYRWWSSFPDVRIMHKYSGAMRPYAAEIAQRVAARWGLARLLPEAAAVSQRLQFLEAKGKIEMLRRDYPRLAGICHFNGMDTNPSPQGIVDQFYERKHADAALWRRTNGDTVALCGLNFDNRVLSAKEPFRCRLYVSDFSHPPLVAPALEWRLMVDDEPAAAGSVTYKHEPYCTCAAGEIEATAPVLDKPAAARLEVRLVERERVFTNSWNVWILPPDAPLPEGLAIHGPPQYSWLKDWPGIPTVPSARLQSQDRPRAVLTERLDASLVEYIMAGGRVMLAATEGLVRAHPPLFPGTPYAGIRYFFTPPANYGPYQDGQNGTIIRDHPMLGGLPHEGFADLQFFRLMENAPPIDLAPLELGGAEPVIRVIHRYPVFRPLAYLIEARCGHGGLILCALDLNPAFAEARYLLGRICEYAAGPDFSPAEELSDAALARIVACTALP